MVLSLSSLLLWVKKQHKGFDTHVEAFSRITFCASWACKECGRPDCTLLWRFGKCRRNISGFLYLIIELLSDNSSQCFGFLSNWPESGVGLLISLLCWKKRCAVYVSCSAFLAVGRAQEGVMSQKILFALTEKKITKEGPSSALQKEILQPPILRKFTGG